MKWTTKWKRNNITNHTHNEIFVVNTQNFYSIQKENLCSNQMKKNTHGNNKRQRKICSQTMKKVVETNSKRRKQLGILWTYLIPKWTYESHEVCATLQQNIYYLMVARFMCMCVFMCVCSTECFVGSWSTNELYTCVRVYVWVSIRCVPCWKQSRAVAMTIAVVQSQISSQTNDGM